ncbi:MAG: chromate efflux transporter [Desulfosporosinus sp.]|nr:chromate efflux transporter [Desulfosporosinus sp.]
MFIIDTPKKPSFKEAALFWLKLGFIGFGGPAGQIAIMREYLVAKKKWLSDAKFMHALNYCMLLPGPEAQQLATYSGWLLHGTIGGLVAGILFVLPSMFILLALSLIYVTLGNIPLIHAMFDGLKPAVIAIIVTALMKISKKSLNSSIHISFALASFVAIFFFNIPFPLIVLGAIVIGFLVQKFSKHSTKDNSKSVAQAIDESSYYLNTETSLPHTKFKWVRASQQLLIGIVLWFLPLAVFYLLLSDFSFWRNLSIFFTKAAFVTFGGAYAVLPYVAQVSVEQFHWLTHLQMIDGLALGETTPGPLIMVLVFVGFMGGYNHFGGSLWLGSLALVVTTFYTFLPCFLFIFIGAPIVEQTQGNAKVKTVLGFVTAAVVGVLLNLTVYLFKTVVFPHSLSISQMEYVYMLWIILSFVALQRFKVNMIIWIGISAVFGLLHYFVF